MFPAAAPDSALLTDALGLRLRRAHRAEYPGKQVRVVRSVAEANLVVLHCHQVWPTDANKDWAGIDIFRFDEAGKIVEHWDVLQVVPADAKHGNGMF